MIITDSKMLLGSDLSTTGIIYIFYFELKGGIYLSISRTSMVAQTVNHLPTVRVRSLGWEDPLEKEVAIHSSTLAWKIPWMEEHGRLQSMGSQRVGHD